ncbi:MAG: FAD-binding oxidoreductase, partial [Actinobacteria bacterium]|nr:FAD-binding oxidoreductase [Actinomycetota bacterium]
MAATADVVVVGAGIAGVSAAYHLSRRGVARVVIADPRPPLTLTSDKSTECYRNFWPNPEMVALTNRSIDLLEELAEESGDYFSLTRRGYLFVTADPTRLDAMTRQAVISSGYGTGPVRRHPGPHPHGQSDDGIDVLTGQALREAFPYLSEEALGALHVRRAGWFSAQQLGALMLERFRDAGGELVVATVTGIVVDNDRVRGVRLDDGSVIDTPTVVVAAGPMAPNVAALAGVELPLFSELHLKVSFRDHLGVIPRDAPMLIWSDPQHIEWSDEERAGLVSMGREELLGEMPVFCHGRPEGGADSPYFTALWEYHQEVMGPVWPLPEDPLYPEVVMRGLTRMIPRLEVYLDRLPPSSVDGGYYTKTAENRPLIGPAGQDGLQLVAGLSGFGVMVSAAAGDLLAAHICGEQLPDHAAAFLLDRYD